VVEIAVVGLGLIGSQRVDAVRKCGFNLSATYDPFHPERSSVRSLSELLEKCPELIVIATPHDSAIEIAERAIEAGARILVEKPLARNRAEFRQFCTQIGDSVSGVSVGLNYPYFAGIAALIRDTKSGQFGDLLRIRTTMGHGGAPSDSGSWKLDPVRAGGGCLLDPGVHLLDLICILSESIPSVTSVSTTAGFWSTGIEEQALCVFETPRVPQISLDLSVCQWRSEFRIEVIGKDGYGVVTGRGRSYGQQRYVRGRRWSWINGRSQSENEELVVETDCADSFVTELRDVALRVQGSMGLASFERMAAVHELLHRIKQMEAI
jgi:predicted dehydrogenase